MACATNDDAHLLIVGNDLSTGHRRSGLNSLTSYGWDFVKLGLSGMPYKTDGKTPEDFYTQGERVLRARQMLGKVGNSGFSGVPHIHFNLITGPKWLQAKGLPALAGPPAHGRPPPSRLSEADARHARRLGQNSLGLYRIDSRHFTS